MFYEQQPFEELTDAYIADMRAGLRGEASTLMMLPSFLPAASAPRTGESVLVLDAGGTNLRAGRVRFDEAGKPVTEALQKRRMPGTLGRDTSAEEMFRAFAELALTVALDADRACIAFSFPCECLPNGDGRIISMGKESRVTGAEGKLVCEGIETAMRALGASGARRWRLINDTVGSMLGGMASCDRSRYADFIGFILGHRRGRGLRAARRPPGGKNDLWGILPSAAARNAAPCGKGRISLGKERGEYRRALRYERNGGRFLS